MKLYFRDKDGVMRAVDGVRLVDREMKVLFIDKSVYTLTSDDSLTTMYHRVDDAKWYLVGEEE